ncbi:hypothetical protein BDP27DRAFT_1310822 [Rhodocollybia butyracea]|uniref:PROP1-like PPR domain-containing protein n=1 Tax=Rhodocollybia butyracea TaxID=206335 RepID=A0A9P5QAM2_9AGAR|nr:hypothetical protein BDP27DRAFT_1310822 [Rhodocollybia butyracea]
MLLLPKVAYAASRVSTTLGQNPAVRNAFHLHSLSPSSSTKTSSPGSNYFQQNKGSSKPLYNFFDQASGGSKNRFTHGYLGVQPIIANDTCYTNDDYEELVLARPVTTLYPKWYRNRSLSYTQQRLQRLSVLSTRAFSQVISTGNTEPESSPSSPPLTRRLDHLPIDAIPLPIPTPKLDSFPPSAGSIKKLNPDVPRPSPPPIPIAVDEESEHFRALVHARSSGDHRAALQSNSIKPLVQDFNAGLEALYYTRTQGSPLADIQGLYDTMICLGIQPNSRTYSTLIYAHCDRDREVVWALKGMDTHMESRMTLGFSDLSTEDKAQKDALMKENNFATAVSIFRILRTVSGRHNLQRDVLFCLLKGCAQYGSIDVAILVWETIELLFFKPYAVWYRLMILTFSRAGEIEGAEDVFTDFREQSAVGKIFIHNDDPSDSIHATVAVWNAMIEAYFANGKPDLAIGLLEKMLEPREDSPYSDHQFSLPYPAPSTYTTIISGFCNSGDYQSAMTWFNTLLAQSSSPGHAFEPSLSPTRPNTTTWRVLLQTLSQSPDTLSELNALWSRYLDSASQDEIPIRPIDRHLVAHRNVEFVKKAVTVKPLLEDRFRECHRLLTVAQSTVDLKLAPTVYAPSIWETYVDLGLPLLGMDFALRYFDAFRDNFFYNFLYREQLDAFSHYFCSLDWTKITSGKVALRYALKHENIVGQAGMTRPAILLHVMRQYTYARSQFMAVADLDEVEVKRLCGISTKLEMLEPQERDDFIGLVPFLKDLVEYGAQHIPFLFSPTRNAILRALMYGRSVYQVKALIEELGLEHFLHHSLVQLMPAMSASSFSPRMGVSPQDNEPETSLTMPPDLPLHLLYKEADSSRIPQQPVVDRASTQHLGELLLALSRRPSLSVKIWDDFCKDLTKVNKVPSPYTLSRMCQAFGRSKQIQKVKFVYSVAQVLVRTMEHDRQMQLDACGEIDAAHVHRQRILRQGGAPSADAYGGLILKVKETTDDASNAMTLFNESQRLGVVPNHYLYNNIISKLAKARKADAVLELFGKMKASGPMPSSITYGAVLGACARVGDVTSAEALFEEMTKATDFKPKIPPFNTMMQLYTTTNPNKDRALFYYEKMRSHDVLPTAYTYKLLIDAHVIEPPNILKMEQVFQQIVDNQRIELQGAHFASLINAYGCAAKDLDRALVAYNSIFDHPRKPVIDALVFEAIANVCVVHRRVDLIPQIVAKMNDVGVHMTAYIVNVMIKGYAAVGDIESARRLFESLVDSPEGIAALYNHTPRDPSSVPSVHPLEPVYREPSTWEAMVRAELGSGDRQHGIALIERLEARKYPEAVVNRIRGCLASDLSFLP